LSTSIVFLEPGEQGLIERFGRPLEKRPVLEPGAHFKLPWPIDRVQRFRTRELQSFNIGFEPHDDEHQERTLLWNVSHYKEEVHMLVASRERLGRAADEDEGAPPPVNLLTVSAPVQYQVGDVRAWAYNHADSGALLKSVATREVVRYLVSVDFHEIMSTGRREAAEILRERIQERADELELGVSVVFVGLQDIHPPVEVAPDFQAVVGAQQEIEAEILRAHAFRARTVPAARAEAERKIREAEIYQIHTVANAAARAGQFTNQITAYAAAPQVYPERAYLQTLTRAIQDARKYVIGPADAHSVIQLDLQDKVRPDLLDIQID
jgi:modulator of FtsH protease HflK